MRTWLDLNLLQLEGYHCSTPKQLIQNHLANSSNNNYVLNHLARWYILSKWYQQLPAALEYSKQLKSGNNTTGEYYYFISCAENPSAYAIQLTMLPVKNVTGYTAASGLPTMSAASLHTLLNFRLITLDLELTLGYPMVYILLLKLRAFTPSITTSRLLSLL